MTDDKDERPTADDADHLAEIATMLKDIKAIQKESLDRQNRFLWVSIPIFAVLCIQATLLLFR